MEEEMMMRESAKLIVDPRVDLEQQVPEYIEKGGEYVRYQTEISQDRSDSSISFSIIPPNKSVGVDRKMYIDVSAEFEFSGDAGGGNTLLDTVTVGGTEYLVGAVDALRWMPLQSVTESLRFTFNQSTVSQNMSDYIEALSRAGFTQEFETQDMSIGPSMHDQFQEYNDWVQWGAARNPLLPYGDNVAQQPRGGLEYVVTQNTQTAARVQVSWSEPILMSPLLFSKLESKAFIGLTNIDVTWNLGDLTRMWSHDLTATLPPAGGWVTQISLDRASISTTSLGGQLPNPAMRLCYLTPLSLQPIPLVNKYDYYSINRYPTTAGSGTVAAGASGTVDAQNIQLSGIPKLVYIFIRQRNSDRAFGESDAYARINQIRIQFNNKNALLGSATSRDLYEMSVRNGLQMSWSQWYKHTGSVCVIDFANDIGLDASEAVGSRGQYQFQVSVDFTNPGTNAKNYVLYTVPVNPGVFTIADTKTSLDTNMNRPLDVLMAEEGGIEAIPYHDAYDFQGGSFFGKIKKWGRRLLPYVRQALPYVKTGLDWGAKILPYAAFLAAGQGQTGAGVTGGAAAPRKRLQRRM